MRLTQFSFVEIKHFAVSRSFEYSQTIDIPKPHSTQGAGRTISIVFVQRSRVTCLLNIGCCFAPRQTAELKRQCATLVNHPQQSFQRRARIDYANSSQATTDIDKTAFQSHHLLKQFGIKRRTKLGSESRILMSHKFL